MPKYPPGYKFAPSELELLSYLRYKTINEKNDDEDKVPLKFVDIHKVTDPGVLFKNTKEDSVYIFTQFRKVSQNGTGKRYDRTVGCYTWSGGDKAKAVEEGNTRLGWARNFSFEKNKKKLGYNMKELTLDDSFGKDAKLKDYVVCIIKRKPKEEEESKEENLQGGIEEYHPELAIPDEYIDDHGYYFPTPINSCNGFTDIANSTEVQQYYHETNETIIPAHDVPLMLSAQGYQNLYQDMPSNIIEPCQYQNQMNIDSTTAIVPYQISQELDQHINSNYAELDVIMELSSAPPNLSLSDDDYSMYYSATSDSQSIAPFPTGNQLEINESVSKENAMEIEQQPIAKPPSPAILPLNAEGGEPCSEIGRKLAAQLTSLREKPSDIIIKGGLINNQRGLENLIEYFNF
ncbi:hypothetical protein ACH5RR_029802 [Cinchona calisaya]|uniref:NAC domain-containing protein n=1 Tax=Cinchona calisaya TaxID=153742 RepID=A0ABD2YV07_9GENT